MQIVEVLWDDACSASGWKDEDESRKHVQLLPCRTVGYLLTKTSKFVSVVQSSGDTNGHVSEAMTIPRSTVRKIRVLK